jgi:hypothetical protein
LILGLTYAWLIDPVQLYNTTPVLLRSDHRHDWIRLAALGYVADGDHQRVLDRLEGLNEEDVQVALSALIENYASQGRPAETMRLLSVLAQQLGVETPAMLVYLGTPPPSPTPPPPSPSPPPFIVLPTPVTTPTPSVSPPPVSSPHRVISQTVVCDGTVPQLKVLVRAAPEEEEDEEGTALAGVVLWLTWPAGADRAVTGLRPWIDPGYADFMLEPGLPYALSVGAPNAPVLSGLRVQPCPAGRGEEPRLGSWQVVLEIGLPQEVAD